VPVPERYYSARANDVRRFSGHRGRVIHSPSYYEPGLFQPSVQLPLLEKKTAIAANNIQHFSPTLIAVEMKKRTIYYVEAVLVLLLAADFINFCPFHISVSNCYFLYLLICRSC
jgi:hypothetical protein